MEDIGIFWRDFRNRKVVQVILQLGGDIKYSWFYETQVLRDDVERELSEEFMQKIGITADTATSLIIEEAQMIFANKVVDHYLYSSMMPWDARKHLTKLIGSIDASDSTLKEYIEKVNNSIKNMSSILVPRSVDIGQIIAILLVFLLSASAILLLGGTWRSLIAF